MLFILTAFCVALIFASMPTAAQETLPELIEDNASEYQPASAAQTRAAWTRGDANGDGDVDLCDVVLLKRFLKVGDVVINEKNADYNKSMSVDEDDFKKLRAKVGNFTDWSDTYI